ncbi:MAG: response regulator [Pseudomonadota bacterium]
MVKRDFCTTRDAAEMLGVSLRTAQLWVDSGILKAWRTEGGHRRIELSSVESLLREESPARAGKSAPALPATLGQLKVLVVEDDNILLKLYRLQFDSWKLPIELTTAANGYDALVLIGREQPDLMIADLSMPGMDGFQMIRSISNSSFREGLEIVVVTGMDDTMIANHGGLPPGVRLMRKPIPFTELKALIEGMINRRHELSRG